MPINNYLQFDWASGGNWIRMTAIRMNENTGKEINVKDQSCEKRTNYIQV